MLNKKIEKQNCSQINRYGLFAKEKISKDEIIWSPSNDTVKKITISEFHELSKKDQRDWIDHCYQINDYFQMDVDDTRFMNHSCEPNIRIGFEKMAGIAIKNISKEEEITFNYSTTEYDLKMKKENFKCYCGSNECIEIINGFKHLNIMQKRKVRDQLTPYLIRKNYK